MNSPLVRPTTPLFSVFEFIALCTSLFYDPKYFGGESQAARGPRVSILKDDDDDIDWLERGQMRRDDDRQVLLDDEDWPSEKTRA